MSPPNLKGGTLESTNLPRASVDEIYAQIAADLKNAIEMMPAKIYPKGSDMTGHATKYAAEATEDIYYSNRISRLEPVESSRRYMAGLGLGREQAMEDTGYDFDKILI